MAAKSLLAKSSVPFPFGNRDPEQDRRLFGEDRRPAFKFETMASEFETADEWNDSGIGQLTYLNLIKFIVSGRYFLNIHLIKRFFKQEKDFLFC